jgi:hypothetical protein
VPPGAKFGTAAGCTIAKSSLALEFFEFCNGVFRGRRRKSLSDNGLRFDEKAQIAFGDAKLAPSTKNIEKYRI